MEFVVAVVSWIGAEVGGTIGAMLIMNAEAVALTALVASTLAVGSSAASRARRKAKDAYNAAQVDRLANVDQTIVPRKLVLGRARVGGKVFFKGSTGGNKERFVMLLALAAHEIDAVESVYLNDVEVERDGDGWVTTDPYALGALSSQEAVLTANTTSFDIGYLPHPGSVAVYYYTGDSGSGELTYPGAYVVVDSTVSGSVVSFSSVGLNGGRIVWQKLEAGRSNARVRAYLGGPGQAASARVIELFPDDWDAQKTSTGVAYLEIEFIYSETAFPSGLPAVSAVIRGAKVYDPRSGLTAWSENPAVLQRHVLTHPQFGKRTSISAEEDARIVAAANACDIAHDYGDGSVALYRASWVGPFGAPAYDVLDDLAQSMAGKWAYAAGQFYTRAGVYTAPVMSLGEQDLVLHTQGNDGANNPVDFNVSTHTPRAQLVNTITPRIWDAAQDYKQVPLSPLEVAAYVTADGAKLTSELDLTAVFYDKQAYHIAGVSLRDARDALVLDATFKLRAWPLELFDVVSITLPWLGWASKTFEVLERTYSPDSGVRLKLKETASAIYQPDAGFPANGFASNTSLPRPWDISAPSVLTLQSGTDQLVRQLDGTIVARVLVTWPQITDASIVNGGSVELQWRAIGAEVWQSAVVDGAYTQAYLAGVQDGAAIVVRARVRNNLAVSVWGKHEYHTVLGKTQPPPAFDRFLVLAQPDGTRQYQFGYTTSQAPVDWLGAQIRYIAGTVADPVWADMTPLQADQTYYTASPVEINAPLAGEWTFACRSVDATGSLSTALVQSITLPARRLGGFVFDEFYEHTEGWPGTLENCRIVGGVIEALDATAWESAPAGSWGALGASTWGGLDAVSWDDLTDTPLLDTAVPARWADWLRWNTTPASPIAYTTPVRDLGFAPAGRVDVEIDAVGAVVQELATSSDGATWSAWGSAAAPFAARYIKLRATVTATGGAPVPGLRSFGYTVNAPVRSEYLNDVVISGLSGAYRIGVGDIRIPLQNTYSVIKRTSVIEQDSSGAWTHLRIDQDLSPGPRWQFRKDGVLADPEYVDFFVEGY